MMKGERERMWREKFILLTIDKTGRRAHAELPKIDLKKAKRTQREEGFFLL